MLSVCYLHRPLIRKTMAEQKTKPTGENVREWLDLVQPDQKRADCLELLKIMESVTGEQAVMWGSMIGFGFYHYKYDSGHEGDCFLTGFSPRKQNISIYVMPGFDRHPELMANLGKYKTGKSCLYINKLADVDKTLLTKLIREAYRRSLLLKKSGKNLQ